MNKYNKSIAIAAAFIILTGLISSGVSSQVTGTDAMMLFQNPDKFIKENDYASRTMAFKTIDPLAGLDKYQAALRKHFEERIADMEKSPTFDLMARDSAGREFVKDNIAIVKKYIKDIERTGKLITNPTDATIAARYLELSFRENLKVEKIATDEVAGTGIKVRTDKDGRINSISFEQKESAEFPTRKTELDLARFSIFDKNRFSISAEMGHIFIQDGAARIGIEGSAALENLHESMFGKGKIGVVMKNADAEILFWPGKDETSRSFYFKDQATSKENPWVRATLGSQADYAEIRPKSAAFFADENKLPVPAGKPLGYFTIRQTNYNTATGTDTYLASTHAELIGNIESSTITWGPRTRTDNSMHVDSLANMREITAREGTAISRPIPKPAGTSSPPLLQDVEASSPQVRFKDGKPYYSGTRTDASAFQGMKFISLDGTTTWDANKGCHYSALCNQCLVTTFSGSPNPKEAALSSALSRLTEARTLREAKEVQRSLPPRTGMVSEQEYDSAVLKTSGSTIDLGEKRIWRDLKPAGLQVFANLKSDPEFAATINNPQLRSRLEESFNSLLKPIEGWIGDNYKSVLVKSSPDQGGYKPSGMKGSVLGYIDAPARVQARVLEYKGQVLGLMLKVGPASESPKQWPPQHIYIQNPDHSNKDLVKVLQKVQSQVK